MDKPRKRTRKPVVSRLGARLLNNIMSTQEKLKDSIEKRRYRKQIYIEAEILSWQGRMFDQLKGVLDEGTAMHFDTVNFMVRALYFLKLLTEKERNRVLDRMCDEINEAIAARRTNEN